MIGYWAEIDPNGTVLRVLVVDDDANPTPKFLTDTLGGQWARTDPAKPDYAAIGFRWTGTTFAPPTPPDALEPALSLLVARGALTQTQADAARQRAR